MLKEILLIGGVVILILLLNWGIKHKTRYWKRCTDQEFVSKFQEIYPLFDSLDIIETRNSVAKTIGINPLVLTFDLNIDRLQELSSFPGYGFGELCEMLNEEIEDLGPNLEFSKIQMYKTIGEIVYLLWGCSR